MKKKNITIEDLAIMVQKGFEETAKKTEVNLQFKGINLQFKEVNERLERIEKLILTEHKRRIERLETEVKELKELLMIK